MLPRKIIPAITMVRSFLILFALMLVNSSAFATPNNVNCSTTKMCATAGSDDSEPSLESVKRLEDIKAREAELYRLLGDVRREKATALASRPLHIGIIGFGRFGQFIAKSFVKHGHRVVASPDRTIPRRRLPLGRLTYPSQTPSDFSTTTETALMSWWLPCQFFRSNRPYADCFLTWRGWICWLLMSLA